MTDLDMALTDINVAAILDDIRGNENPWLREPLLRFFRFAHLPTALQAYSKPWAALAVHICESLPPSAERTVALRKLLEGKDAAVRAALPTDP